MSGLEHVQVTTAEVPDHLRREAIHDYFGRMLQRMDYSPWDERQPYLQADAWLLPDLTLGQSVFSAFAIERTRPLLADGRSDVMLCRLPAGGSVSLPSGDQIEVAPGDFFLAALNYRLSFRLPSSLNEQTTMFQLPRSALGGLDGVFDDLPLRALPQAQPEMQLLLGYGRAVLAAQPNSAELKAAASRHLVDLATLALGASREAAQMASRGGVRAAQLVFAKQEILARLTDPDLSAAKVAARLRISKRYLHMLFETCEDTFSTFLTHRRLARAHKILMSPHADRLRVLDIAFDVGFRELRTFNRAFRARYGCTPSELRASRLRGVNVHEGQGRAGESDAD